ncbi:cytochrome oxidase putative small subunit CydP [Undibacterium jejuense]|uniref:cytochrome oxidase putative small subunit CydP n=1 Tax=Undibacterium jejuense TaxID=1344949 RepID=UPI003621E934
MKPALTIRMNPKRRHLRFHLFIVVLLKLVAITLIWWFFIRDEAVDVNADFMASRIGIPVISQGASK